ncbi:patatin-like phospholipase family protein [Bradyrhizobium sp. CCGUVB14]|uniref:patatin-like phospholipase family protein n=1 Tax=Bradyrhizobium sp. CCGUVB14 TaxID=2949628 RepID=UPI0020B3E9EE|nr:patatin-like phospholipase family protein [Bradyrhizobium sp. CCGUVB14]MCP3446190.1 patatin-like phospholipase family protein [Bradyrhizobium sp. CCGUVB14]
MDTINPAGASSVPEDATLIDRATWLVRETLQGTLDRGADAISPQFVEYRPYYGQYGGPEGYFQVSRALSQELNGRYFFGISQIAPDRVLVGIIVRTPEQNNMRLSWELTFEDGQLLSRTMLGPGCSFFWDLFHIRQQKSRWWLKWDYFWDELSDVLAGLVALRVSLIVCTLFAALMLLPRQTGELLREVPFNREDPFSFVNLVMLVGYLTFAIAIFGLIQLYANGHRTVVPIENDVRLDGGVTFKARRFGLVGLLASSIPLVAGLALLESRLPVVEQEMISWWQWFSVLLLTSPYVSAPSASLIDLALSFWGRLLATVGGIAGLASLLLIARPGHWLGSVQFHTHWIVVFLAGLVVAVAFGLLFLIPTEGTSAGPTYFACWLMLFLGVLTCVAFVSSRTRVPLLLLSTIWFIILSRNDANDHHIVRPSDRQTIARAPNATEALKNWLGPLNPSNTGREPVVVVAAEGGGIRAAVMTAMVLDQLRVQDKDFVHKVFAMIGVSGGSIGTAAFAAAVRQERPAVSVSDAIKPSELHQNWQAALHHDLLSPTLRSLLGMDLLTHLWPRAWGDLSVFDRARALESSLENSWKDATGKDISDVAFDDLRPRPQIRDPSLILMTTSVNSGEPVAVSHINGFGIATLEDQAPEIRVPLTTAALMSARFPVITPAATVSSNGSYLHYVDGGYFENSGITAAISLIQSIRDPALLKRAKFVVLHIINGSTEEEAEDQASTSSFSEFSAPLAAAYLSGGAHENMALVTLKRLTQQDPNGTCTTNGTCPVVKEITFRLIAPRVKLPLA